MVSIKKVTTVVFCMCLIISFLSFPFVAVAKDVTVVPSIALRGEYNDNVSFRRTDELDDYLAVISPALTLDYATELFNLKARGNVDVSRYSDQRQYDNERQRYAINGGYRLIERWTLSGDFSYIQDTTLDSELEETGIVYVREDRKRYNAGAGLSYQVSELSDMKVNYAYSKTDYGDPALREYDNNSINLFYNRKFNDGIDVFTVKPGYRRNDSSTSIADSYRLSLGWTHLPSETYRLSVFLGGRYTEQDFEDEREKGKTWGWAGDINLQKTTETRSILMGFKSDLYSSPSKGELDQVYRVYCDLTQRILERLSASVYGRISLARPEDKDSDEDKEIWFFDVTPSLSYRITQNHSLRLAYSYSQEYNKNLEDDRRRNRNRVWLSLNFRFPGIW